MTRQCCFPLSREFARLSLHVIHSHRGGGTTAGCRNIIAQHVTKNLRHACQIQCIDLQLCQKVSIKSCRRVHILTRLDDGCFKRSWNPGAIEHPCPNQKCNNVQETERRLFSLHQAACARSLPRAVLQHLRVARVWRRRAAAALRARGSCLNRL